LRIVNAVGEIAPIGNDRETMTSRVPPDAPEPAIGRAAMPSGRPWRMTS